MADRPIIFSAPMVRKLLGGRKTQTRRIVKLYPSADRKRFTVADPDDSLIELSPGEFASGICHYLSVGALSGPYKIGYAVGDRLWVRETWTLSQFGCAVYRADARDQRGDRWVSIQSGDPRHEVLSRPSIHMPRWASRLTLTITDVRVQRLQDISEEDAVAEGCDPYMAGEGIIAPPRHGDEYQYRPNYRLGFEVLWNSIYGRTAWNRHPWVVALTFRVECRHLDKVSVAS